MLRGYGCHLVLALCLTFAPPVIAKPFVPDDDAVVLERLPEKSDPSLAVLKRQRAALARNPADATLAATVARRAIEAGRATGDPRAAGDGEAIDARFLRRSRRARPHHRRTPSRWPGAAYAGDGADCPRPV